jgi:2-methylcitrate dehydratase PrpD
MPKPQTRTKKPPKRVLMSNAWRRHSRPMSNTASWAKTGGAAAVAHLMVSDSASARGAVMSSAHYSFETTSSFSTPNTPSTSRALSPATVLSDSLSTTPISVVRPFRTMM